MEKIPSRSVGKRIVSLCLHSFDKAGELLKENNLESAIRIFQMLAYDFEELSKENYLSNKKIKEILEKNIICYEHIIANYDYLYETGKLPPFSLEKEEYIKGIKRIKERLGKSLENV